MLERQLEAYFLKQVKAVGGISIKIAPMMAGVPDRLILLPHRPAMLVELKTETGRTSRIQDVWHERAARIGHIVYVLHGKKEVDEWLQSQMLL